MSIVSREAKMGYDPWITIRKAIKSFVVTGGAIGLSAIATWAATPGTQASVLEAAGARPELVAVLAPVLTAAFRAVDNWLKNRQRKTQ